MFKIHIIAPVIIYECKTGAFFAISCYLKFLANINCWHVWVL